MASLPVDAPLWVQIGQQDELAEADLKYVGPLTRGSSAVVFGVQLKVNLNGGFQYKPLLHWLHFFRPGSFDHLRFPLWCKVSEFKSKTEMVNSATNNKKVLPYIDVNIDAVFTGCTWLVLKIVTRNRIKNAV